MSLYIVVLKGFEVLTHNGEKEQDSQKTANYSVPITVSYIQSM